MKKILDKLMKEKELCEIHTSFSDKDSFNTGYGIATDDYYALFQMVSPDGMDDGIYLQAINSIDVISIKTEYIAAIKRLMTKEKFNITLSERKCENCMKYILNEIKNTKQICTIYVDDGWGLCGKIEDMYEDIVELRSLEVTGREDGFEYLRIDDIESISTKSSDERKVQFLNDNLSV